MKCRNLIAFVTGWFAPGWPACPFLLIAAGLISQEAHAQAGPGNVLLFIADDLGRQLGCYGDANCQTPNLDALARRGVLFTRAYGTVASCSPSRASIYSGLYTHQNGQYGLQQTVHKQECHPWVQGLPNLLRAAGYWTGLIGKYHVGPDSSFQWDRLATRTRGRDPQSFAEHTRTFIDEAGPKPFFLTIGFQDPHRVGGRGFGNEVFANEPAEVKYDPKAITLPYYLPDSGETRADWAEYLQSISRMDRGVGLVLDVLRATGRIENTLILFVSDNGPPFPGAKTTLYGSGIHLPLIMAGPGLPAGRTNGALVSYIDLAPTILDFAGAKTPVYREAKLWGESLLPIARAENAKGRDAVFGSHQFHEITVTYPMRTIVKERFKLIVNLDHEKSYPFASDLWISPSWQYMRKTGGAMLGQRSVASYLRRPKEELYDLTNDPNELKNLAADAAHATVLGDLRRQLRAWQTATNDPWTVLYREEDASFGR